MLETLSKLTIITATMADAEVLFKWVANPETHRQSFATHNSIIGGGSWSACGS